MGTKYSRKVRAKTRRHSIRHTRRRNRRHTRSRRQKGGWGGMSYVKKDKPIMSTMYGGWGPPINSV